MTSSCQDPASFFVENFPAQRQVEVSYYLNEGGPVKIDVFNVRGRLVGEIANEWRPAGHHEVRWQYGSVGSGIYMVRGQLPGRTWTSKVTVLK
jgi:hypothetical protein